MSRTVFFSWQSDRSTKEGRNLIEKALEDAVARIATDVTVEEAVREGLKVDKDTKGVPGSPPVFDTILKKIDKASVFVADLTICGNRCDGRPTPNPNVLIEYGWALKALGYHQVLTIMNVAHGEPSQESMPFDLAHIRFPITYNMEDEATDGKRREVREQLSKILEAALRNIFESEEFKAKLPKPETPPQFQNAKHMNGRGRFRAAGKPLGAADNIFAKMLGSPEAKSIFLAEGPTIWLRVMPVHDPGRKWLIQDLKNSVLQLANLPLMSILDGGSRHIGFVRANDGCGSYDIWDDEANPPVTYSIAYVFHTAEIWVVNAWLSKYPNIIPFKESDFTETLDQCVAFLDRLGCRRPYRWVVGMEGIEGRSLVLPPRFDRRKGPCMADPIEDEGLYDEKDNAEQLLHPFFEKVFDHCGERRANYPSSPAR